MNKNRNEQDWKMNNRGKWTRMEYEQRIENEQDLEMNKKEYNEQKRNIDE